MGYYNPYQSIPQQYMAQSYYPQFYSSTTSDSNADPQPDSDVSNANTGIVNHLGDGGNGAGGNHDGGDASANNSGGDHDGTFPFGGGRNLNYPQYTDPHYQHHQQHQQPQQQQHSSSTDSINHNKMLPNAGVLSTDRFNSYTDASGYSGSHQFPPHHSSVMSNAGNSYYDDENSYINSSVGYGSGYGNVSLNGSTSMMGPGLFGRSNSAHEGGDNNINRLNNSNGNSERQSTNSNEGGDNNNNSNRPNDDYNLLLSSAQFPPQLHNPAISAPYGGVVPGMMNSGGNKGHSRHPSSSNPLGVSHLMNPNPIGLTSQVGSAGSMGPGNSGVGGVVPSANNFQSGGQPGGVNSSAPSRTVYLGNIPNDLQPNELLDYVRSGIIETVKILPTKNCAFISFVDPQLALLFHSDCILKKLNIKGNDIRIGWGKNNPIYPLVLEAIQNHGATRNVYLGNLNSHITGSMITEQELRDDLAIYGIIDCIKIIPEKGIAFVHFLSILSAIRCVSELPLVEKYLDKKCYYGKDRCAFITKTQQHNAAQYLGLAPGMEHIVTAADREFISSALVQQSAAAAQIATQAGGANNLGNRTVYLGNLHQDSSVEEICNVVRGGLLQSIRFLKERHVCFITFIDPIAAAQFFAMCQLHGLTIHNRRIKVGWGKHSGPLLNALSLAVSNGASRNIYVGNILDFEYYNPTKLRDDFSKFGEIEQINYLEEKNCAFINFVNIANAIKAIDGIKSFGDYRNLKINFGKDRCGNLPRQFQNQNNMMMPMNNNNNNNNNNSPSNYTGQDDAELLPLEDSPDGGLGTISGLEIGGMGEVVEHNNDNNDIDDEPTTTTMSLSAFDSQVEDNDDENNDLLVDKAANPPI